MNTALSETSLLGTELEVVADFDLTPLLEELQNEVVVLRNSVDDGRHTLWLELDSGEEDVDDAVRLWTGMIEALPVHLRSLWDTSTDRCLNTGIQAGRHPHAYAVGLSAESAAQASRLALRHQFTVYAAVTDSPPNAD
jgi:hypothetical protein